MTNCMDIARKALANYTISYQSIEHIAQSANTVYKVIDTANNCYNLRIHLSKNERMESIWSEQAVIDSEMVWLDSLAHDAHLVVPSPIKNKHNEYVTRVDDISCTLLTWVEGEQKPYLVSVDDIERVGELIGKLHQHSSSWKVPSSYTRPSYDDSRILRSLEKIRQLVDSRKIDPHDAEIILVAGQRALEAMRAIDRSSSNWGIIHADLIPSNLVFYEQEARAIDFGACGFGYYLFDLGWTCSYIHPVFRRQLLESYRKHFILPDHYVQRLESFFVMGQLETMNFWFGLPDSDEWLPAHIRSLASREFLSYVNGEEFLFSGTPYWE